MILPQKESDYMWPLISCLGRFNVHNLNTKLNIFLLKISYCIIMSNIIIPNESQTTVEWSYQSIHALDIWSEDHNHALIFGVK